jgi:hypothetical protein
LAAAGLRPLTADITRPGDLAGLPGPFDWVVNTVSSTRGGLEEYRQVYRDGTRNLVEWLTRTSFREPPIQAGRDAFHRVPEFSGADGDAVERVPTGFMSDEQVRKHEGVLQKYVHTSSTSVYGQTDGSVVDESSPTEPDSPTSQVLVETERLLLEAAGTRQFPAVILRVAGIYGPGRGHLFLQYLRDEARLHGRGERVINMIHRDDVVGATVAALAHGRPGTIYNLADDEPVDQLAFFQWLSGALGKAMPPFATEGTEGRRKRGLTCKRVANGKLKTELGYRFDYPTFREGYAAEIQRLGLTPG